MFRKHWIHIGANWLFFIRVYSRWIIFTANWLNLTESHIHDGFSYITDALGRRRAMLIVNIPFIIAWFMMYRATSVVELFLGYGLLGFGVGLTEAPIITYIGEITYVSFCDGFPIIILYIFICCQFMIAKHQCVAWCWAIHHFQLHSVYFSFSHWIHWYHGEWPVWSVWLYQF